MPRIRTRIRGRIQRSLPTPLAVARIFDDELPTAARLESHGSEAPSTGGRHGSSQLSPQQAYRGALPEAFAGALDVIAPQREDSIAERHSDNTLVHRATPAHDRRVVRLRAQLAEPAHG